jgi:hypothetical protein
MHSGLFLARTARSRCRDSPAAISGEPDLAHASSRLTANRLVPLGCANSLSNGAPQICRLVGPHELHIDANGAATTRRRRSSATLGWDILLRAFAGRERCGRTFLYLPSRFSSLRLRCRKARTRKAHKTRPSARPTSQTLPNSSSPKCRAGLSTSAVKGKCRVYLPA